MPRPKSDDLAKAVGERVRQARTALGITQEQLAERTGVQAETVSRIERGASAPSLATLSRIARALGNSLGSLVGEDAQPDSLTADERRLVAGWRGLSARQRGLVLGMVEELTTS